MSAANHIPDERLLLQLLQEGNERAFAQLYKKNMAPLLWKLEKMVRDRDQAEELLQDLFIKVWERREQVDASQPFSAYLYRIAKNMVVDHFRKIAREAKLYQGVRAETTELDVATEETIYANETNKILREAIESLPPQRKQAFILCKIEGKSHQEAALLMGISPNTIHNHLVKSVATIKKHLEKSGTNLSPLFLLFALLHF